MSGTAFLLLQSIDQSDLAFFVVPVCDQLFPMKSSDQASACRTLQLDGDHTEFFAIVTASRDETGIQFFANVRAPLLIDFRQRVGAQVVLANPEYPVRQLVRAQH